MGYGMISVADALREAFARQVETAPPADAIPASQDDAERARDEAASGLGPIKAWKLGATIAAVRRDLGLSRQFFGPLPASLVFEDGAVLDGFHTRLRGVESEYGFELARDVEPGDAERDEADFLKLFACVRPAIEIPGTRFASLGLYGGFGLVADFGAAGGLALGPACALEDAARLDSAAVRLSFAGRQVVSGGAGVIDGGAMGPLRVFLRQALKAGYELQAGQTIVTGSCTGYLKAPPGERVEATFEALGASVSLTFAH
jgi:2-keto-4-pentenoate hydratase